MDVHEGVWSSSSGTWDDDVDPLSKADVEIDDMLNTMDDPSGGSQGEITAPGGGPLFGFGVGGKALP
jgi:hypothetical protein